MSALDVLRAYFYDKVDLTEGQFDDIARAFVLHRVRTGEFVQRGGEVATRAAFVASGCMRVYVIDAKGKEHIVRFVPETWWWSDPASLMSGAPSQYFFEAVEDSELLLIDSPSHQRLLDDVPPFAAMFRAGVQKHSAAKDERIVSSLSESAEERYMAFLKTYPS